MILDIGAQSCSVTDFAISSQGARLLKCSIFGSRACYVALILVTVNFLCVCLCLSVCPSVQRLSPLFLNRSWWNFVWNWISVCSCVLSKMGVFSGRSHPKKTVFTVKLSVLQFGLDRAVSWICFTSLECKTTLEPFFDHWSTFGKMSWRIEQKSPDTFGTSLN